MAYGSGQYGGGSRLLVASDFVSTTAAAALVASSSLSATGTVNRAAAASLTATSTLTAVPPPTFGTAALAAASALTVAGALVRSGAAGLSATGSLTATATVILATHVTGSFDVDVSLADATLTVVLPTPVALAGSLDLDLTTIGTITVYVPPPPPDSTPPSLPPPPPPPPALVDDGGTIPLLSPGRVLVSVFKPDAISPIANVAFAQGQQWLDEMNAPGTGTFQIHLDDPILQKHPDLLDEFNIVKFTVRGTKVKAWQIEDVTPTMVSSGENSSRWATVTGRGVLSVLETAVVYPERWPRANAPEVRHFDFASKDGPWLVSSEWIGAVGTLWSADATARHGLPAGWPDPNAYWLWSSSPSASAPAGRNWFRSSFSVTDKTVGLLYFAADNVGTVYLDGVIVGATDDSPWSFKTLDSFPVTLEAGEHTIAVWVDNSPAATLNPGGMLLTIMGANAVGTVTTANIFRTTPFNTIVKAYGAAPGWHAANVLQQVITEAQARGVSALESITFGFTASADTAGNPWPDRQDRTVNVGTTDLLDLATQLIEVAFDLELTTEMVLNAWIRRGGDRSADVRLMPGRDVTDAVATVRSGRIKNQALLKSEAGWVELFSAVSKSKYGRRETGLSVGNAGSTDQLVNVGAAALRETSQPETTIPVSYTSVRGPQPYENFFLGDVISVPQSFSGMTHGRLMSIAGSQQDTFIKWDLDFYPHKPDDVIDDVVIGVSNTSSADDLYQSEVLSDSPWGYWRLKETTGTNLADTSGRGNRMTITGGGATLNQVGPVNKAISWSSSAGYATAGSSALFTSNEASLEIWVNLPALPSANTTVFGQAVGGVNGTSHDKEIFIDTSGRLCWYTSYNGVTDTLTYGTALTLNTWYHVVASVGADGKKIYVNGNPVTTRASVTGSYTTRAQQVLIHAGGNTLNGHGAVRVAEPAIYGKQLFDSRVASHYTSLTL